MFTPLRLLSRRLAAPLALAGVWALVAAAGPAAAGSPPVQGPLGPSSFWLATPSGGVYGFGHAAFYGAPSAPPAAPIVSMTPTGDQKGYWLAAADGGVFAYGDANFYGSAGGLTLRQPIVSMAPTPDHMGYWLVATDGGIFAYGDAAFYGSTGGMTLNQPIVDMAPTPDQKGYWLVAADGGVFAYGDAGYYGSTGGMTLTQGIAAMTSTPDGKGYWLVATDGGVFAFGDATFYGSTAGTGSEPAQRLVPTHSGDGYWIIDQNGTVNGFGAAATASPPTQGVVLEPRTPGDRAVLFALLQLNKPYIWGGNGPVGFDCSGLALASWQHAAGVSFARVANDQYHTAGAPVGLTQLEAGDLVFWGSNPSDWTSVDHTAIYIGADMIVQATGDHVQLGEMGQPGSSGLMPNGRRP